MTLPGGARVWSDPNVWIGLYDFYETSADAFGDDDDDDGVGVGGGVGAGVSSSSAATTRPGIEPGTGRALRTANTRRFSPATLAGRMASVGLPPHAVATLLASVSRRLSRRPSGRGNGRTLEKGGSIAGADGDPRRKGGNKGNKGNNGFDASDAEAGLPPRVTPIPTPSADRVGRSVGRVGEVSSSADSDASSRTPPPPSSNRRRRRRRRRSRENRRGRRGVARRVDRTDASRRLETAGESAPGESAPFESAPSQRGSDAENEAPWWARAESTAGVGATSPFLDATTAFFDGKRDGGEKKRRFTVRLNSREGKLPGGGEDDDETSERDTPRRDGAILVDDFHLDEHLAGLDLDDGLAEGHHADDRTSSFGVSRGSDWYSFGRRRGDWCDLPSDAIAASPWSDRPATTSTSTSRRNSIRLSSSGPAHAHVSSHAVTAVAVRAGGGVAAIGSCHGAFAAWNPRTGVVVRARPGGWGEAGIWSVTGANTDTLPHYNPTVGLTALGFTASGDASGNRSGDLAVGGTRGGGVAAWDVRTGACVCAAPGSHAGAVTIVQSATSSATSSSGQVSSADVASGGENAETSGSNAVFGHPALALTASDAPADGRVRLWDVRAGPRETAAALGGHRGGVHAVSAESPKTVFTGDGDGVVRAWDWRRAGGGALASARALAGIVTAVTPLRFDRADVAASAGVDGVVRVLSLDGGSGGGVALVGHLAPVTGLARLGGFFGEGGPDLPDSSKATGHRPVTGHGRRLSSIADLKPGDAAFDRRLGVGGSGGTTDSHLFGRVSGLASASADGAVRLWCPDGAAAGVAVRGGAHAHASRVVAMARCSGAGSSSSGGGGSSSSGGRFFLRARISRRVVAHRGRGRELRAMAGRGTVPSARAARRPLLARGSHGSTGGLVVVARRRRRP